MKVIDKLPKPVKTDVTDSSITLTIDRNRKFRGSVRAVALNHQCVARCIAAVSLFLLRWPVHRSLCGKYQAEQCDMTCVMSAVRGVSPAVG